MKRAAAVLCVVAVACASAGQGGGGGDHPDAKKQADAPDQTQDPDAALPDAAPAGPDAAINATLSQTTDGTSVGSASSVACGNNADGTTAENSWYRVFRLQDAGISGGFHVTSVSVGVQEAAGSPTVQVKIGTYAPSVATPPTTLDTTQVTPIITANLTIPNTAATAPTMATVPISANIPAGGQIIVEIASPDFLGTGKYYYLGGNGGGESRPSYLRAPGCMVTAPTTVSSLGFPTSDLLISVTGTH